MKLQIRVLDPEKERFSCVSKGEHHRFVQEATQQARGLQGETGQMAGRIMVTKLHVSISHQRKMALNSFWDLFCGDCLNVKGLSLVPCAHHLCTGPKSLQHSSSWQPVALTMPVRIYQIATGEIRVEGYYFFLPVLQGKDTFHSLCQLETNSPETVFYKGVYLQQNSYPAVRLLTQLPCSQQCLSSAAVSVSCRKNPLERHGYCVTD